MIDIWFEKRVRKQSKGAAYMVRYADDAVFCFQYEYEARKFYAALIERVAQFGLEISKEKSKIIAFGRNATGKRMDGKRGDGKPETFDFLGFTHYCGVSRDGTFRVKRKTSKKKFIASLTRCKLWIKENRHYPKQRLMEALRIKLMGYYRYYGITDNTDALARFRHEVRRYLFKYLNRRSQRRSYNWDGFDLFLKKYPLPHAKIYVNMFKLRTHISYIL